MKLPLRIAVLECDIPLDKTRAKFGGYGGVFELLLNNAADALGHPGLSSKEGLDIRKYNVIHEELYPNIEDIDAILITGSRHNSFEDVPWIVKLVEFTKKVLEQDCVRVIGVCFGHQIVGRALGQRVYRSDAGWEASVLPVELTQKGKDTFQVDKLSIYQMHKDIVDGVPTSVEQLAKTAICENQGMYQERRLITVQGHPEFTHDLVEEILHSRHEIGIFSDAEYKDAMRRLEDHDDGVIVAKAFLRFLLQD
ncbi:class I glutamine amidotransferase-like protein [Tothia fuscella]|uniref:Class I glutamine amidotransferase-like protein n=1 Tax=Tothia fuscella TaxID=1048955 RepID=A0A9P4TU05_9PEZI|nr:class I glutamine amidotransferase-like protein [Tothia fuscella]